MKEIGCSGLIDFDEVRKWKRNIFRKYGDPMISSIIDYEKVEKLESILGMPRIDIIKMAIDGYYFQVLRMVFGSKLLRKQKLKKWSKLKKSKLKL